MDCPPDSSKRHLSLKEAHSRIQTLFADFDNGREVGYADVALECMAIASSVEWVRLQIQGDIADDSADIWRRISEISASVTA